MFLCWMQGECAMYMFICTCGLSSQCQILKVTEGKTTHNHFQSYKCFYHDQLS